MTVTPRTRRLALLGGLAAAVVVFILLRGRRSDAALELVPAGPSPASALDPGGGGVSAGFDTTSFTALIEERLASRDTLNEARFQDLGAVLGDLRGNMTDLEDFLKSTGATLNEDIWAPPPIDPDWLPPTDPSGAEPDLGPAGQEPPAAPGNRGAADGAKGFWWKIGGKRTRVTRKNRRRFLQELRSKGVSPAAWAARHPAAARAVGIKVPSAPPPSRTGAFTLGRVGVGGGVARALASAARPAPAASRSSTVAAPSRALTRTAATSSPVGVSRAASSPVGVSRAVAAVAVAPAPKFSSGGRVVAL